MGSQNIRAMIDEGSPEVLARQAIARDSKPGASLNWGSTQATSIHRTSDEQEGQMRQWALKEVVRQDR